MLSDWGTRFLTIRQCTDDLGGGGAPKKRCQLQRSLESTFSFTGCYSILKFASPIPLTQYLDCSQFCTTELLHSPRVVFDGFVVERTLMAG